MRRLRSPARDLRTAIDCMPHQTRRAMLGALDVNPIIVGAYTDRDGGVCPMLAAHRNGGRTSFATFAEAWDRYTRAETAPAPRRATEREVNALKTMLQASIESEGEREAGFLSRAISEHRRAQARRARREEHEVSGHTPRSTGEWRQAFDRLDGERYSESPGRMNCSSGTKHAGEVRSR
jgi:hypothetical protein